MVNGGDVGAAPSSGKPWGMFDDLIPPLPLGHTLGAPVAATALPSLPPGYTLDHKPGMFDDLIPQAPAGTQRQPKLVPVDHDPFAQGAPAAQPKLVPVDHDPFAAALAPPVTLGGVPIGSNGLPRVEIAPARPAGHRALHSLAVGMQGIGAGVRDIVAMPFDLAAGAQNLITGGINKILGTNIPAATPASKLVERVTEPFSVSESEMSPGEKLGYKVNRFGTQALGTGAMLAARAPAVAEAVKPAETAIGRVLDSLSRPYTAAPARTVVGDAIGGIGGRGSRRRCGKLRAKRGCRRGQVPSDGC